MAGFFARFRATVAAAALAPGLSGCWGFGEIPLRSEAAEQICAASQTDPAAARRGCGLALERLDPDYEPHEPLRAELHSLRGEAALLSGDASAALRDHDRALALDDAPADYWSRRGWAKLELDRPREAFMDFEAALEREPGDRSARLGRGSAFLALSAPARALPDLESVLSSAPDLTYARLQYARALAQVGRGGEAAAAYGQVLLLDANHIDALLERARLREAYDREAALLDYDLAVARAKDAAPAYYARGRYLDRLGDRSAADADLERAYALGHRDEWLLLRLAKRAR